MKIKDDNLIYNLPLMDEINIIIDNKHSENIINYLMSYFMNKKKSSCTIYDDDGNIITPKEYEFVYIPNKDLISNYEFKDKTILKTYFTNVIMNNPELFLSIDNIRNDMYSLLTDNGVYKIKKLMQSNLNVDIEIDVDNFDVGKLVEMIGINIDEQDNSILMAFLYNILLSLYERKNKIIYIDFEINDNVEKWLLANINPYNIILINSRCIKEISIIKKCNVIVPNIYSEVINDELDVSYLNLFLYMINPYILKYLHYQKEENINFMQNYIAPETTFSIYFK